MNQSSKAALLSALVFPGIGQITLGYNKWGWSLIGVHTVLLFFILRVIIQQAYSVIAEMKKSGITMTIEEISKMTSDLSSFSNNVFLNTVLILFIVGWIVSIIDAYRLGMKI